MALGLACQMLMEIINKNPLNIKKHIEKLQEDMQQSYNLQIKETNQKIIKIKEFKKRIIKIPKDKYDFITTTIDNEISNLKRQKEKLINEKKNYANAFKKFEGYQFSQEEDNPINRISMQILQHTYKSTTNNS